MEDLQSVSIIAGVLAIITLIVFFIMSSNIGKISRSLLHWNKYITKKGLSFKCKHCEFTSVINFDFCPVCKMNEEGKTLEQLQKEYKERVNQ